ncbi:MAG: hypothetical protein A2735_01325 [Candidatus Yanofskybacteria bacterium RIFCSPHIGHO2_01_FULL_41_21]|uniref:Uncharacterized protein n=1 Tax=Candidatus Yanofskybacteria bacterium RIFCSPHIGHO2_01_FULL_41_21 TaxID=1802660 RepID=A0A1F8EAK8_9BACT|nr:MAG: hypothetical protein A2735_01325 [Candidatus Yanofskybacteria bacterium RIFCSPHIGHO2_01_FULL_41_21]
MSAKPLSIVEPDIKWMQDLSNENVGKVTTGSDENCPCPRCGHLIWEPFRDVMIRKNDQTSFTRRCGHCRGMVQFVAFHEIVDEIGERVFLYAAPYKAIRRHKK